MKVKSFLLAALIVASATASIAKEVPATGMAVIRVKGSEIFKVVYKGEATGKVRLNIYNAESRIILTETYSLNGFILPVNFRGLADGEYTIELVDASGKKSEKVNFARASRKSS